MSLDKIDKIKEVSKSLKTLQQEQLPGTMPQGVEPNTERFRALMREETRTPNKIEDNATRPSPMEEAGKVGGKIDPTRKATTQEIVAQAETAVKRIDTVKAKLNTPALELKPSVRNLLNKRLHHIEDSIKTALKKTGTVEPTIAQKGAKDDAVLSPIHRFLGMLTQGQNQLNSLSSTVQELGLSKELSPAAMLAIQIKVTRVQQEIELFTSLLNKALESTKTIMNVQV